MDRNCEMCKNKLPYGCTKWECQFEPIDSKCKMIEELEKIKTRLNHRANEHLDGDYYVRIKDINEVFDDALAELKGE